MPLTLDGPGHNHTESGGEEIQRRAADGLSAFRLMALKASNREKSIPATPARRQRGTPSWEVNTLSPNRRRPMPAGRGWKPKRR